MREERSISAGFARVLTLSLAISTVQVIATAQTVGSCQPSIAVAQLDVNNVRATIRSNGSLFDRDTQFASGFEVPRESGKHAIFSAHLLISGLVGGDIEGVLGYFSADNALWAGPVFPGVSSPPNCDAFDRIYKISREDIVAYEADGKAASDLQDWPTGMGAPTRDANGHQIVLRPDGGLAHVDADGIVQFEEALSFEDRLDRRIDLEAGERPQMLGDQMLWWIMNDLGNTNKWSQTRPSGFEIHGTAFAFSVPGAVGNTTFYRFKIYHKGQRPLEQAYVGMFFDSDLGYFDDDYVGVDTTLGLGFAYNADDDDEGSGGYGLAPPAVGVDLFQGPLVDADGIDNDGDDVIDEAFERLQMTSFLRAILFGGPFEGDVENAEEFYNVMRGLWKDGLPLTVGGTGRDFSTERTRFQFSGAAERGEFWSQINSDGQGTALEPQDTRFIVSSGPFTFRPGDQQEIVFGIVWSRGSDHLDSVRKLKEDDALAQSLFDIGFEVPAAPAAPRVTATPLDGQVILDWTNNPTDNNYLDAYYVVDPLLSSDVIDNDYQFEGYRVYQYTDPLDQTGKLLATYDVANDVTRVIEGTVLTYVTAEGTDSGIQHSHIIEELTNYQSYFFGVQAYAYNASSNPAVYNGPVARVEVVPTRVDAREGGTRVNTEREVDIEAEVVEGATDGSAGVRVVNPEAVTGHEYRIVFREDTLAATGERVVTYDILDHTAGLVKYDGLEALRQTESRRPIASPQEWIAISQRDNVIVVDGLEYDINGPAPNFKWFYVTDNASGPLAEWTGGAAGWTGFPVPTWPGDEQQATNESIWLVHTADNDLGERGSFDVFVSRATNGGDWAGREIVPYDFEIRFTAEGSWALDPFCTDEIFRVPFELWRTGVGTPADRSDDIRMIPYVLDNDFSVWTGYAPPFNLNSTESLTEAAILFGEDFDGDGDIDADDGWCGTPAVDHSVSSRSNDPFTDWIYWATPDDASPGDAGYRAWEAAATTVGIGRNELARDNSIRRMVLVNLNGGSGPPFNADLPEEGTVFRIETTKPNAAALVFSIQTAGLGVETGVESIARSALDEIGIVPNPYKGASAYEVSQTTDEVRFTNMPTQATIRVFDLAGTLVRRLDKDGPDAFFRWDLRTDEALPIASGIYFIHIEVPDVGERALKFAVIRKGTRIQTF